MCLFLKSKISNKMKPINKLLLLFVTILLTNNSAISQNQPTGDKLVLLNDLKAVEQNIKKNLLIKQLDLSSIEQTNIDAQIKSKTTDSLYIIDQNVKRDLLVKESILKQLNNENGLIATNRETNSQNTSLQADNTPKFYVDNSKSLNISLGLALKGKQAEFVNDLSFILLNNKGQNLFVDYGSNIAESNNVKQAPEAYSLTIDNRGISIIGYDQKGARKGIEELRKLLNSPILKGSNFPYLQLTSH